MATVNLLPSSDVSGNQNFDLVGGTDAYANLEDGGDTRGVEASLQNKYNSDIEIVNTFSWEYETDEKFDLVYDDRMEVISEEEHDNQMKKILCLDQWYAGFAMANDNRKISGYPIFFELENVNYVQPLQKYGDYTPCQR